MKNCFSSLSNFLLLLLSIAFVVLFNLAVHKQIDTDETQSKSMQLLTEMYYDQSTRIDQLKQRVTELEQLLGTPQLFEATAYTHAPLGGDINGEGHGITRSGIPVREGIIAVDPAVVPLGTWVWLSGFGLKLAADTGAWIRGRELDIFLDCAQRAIAFGRQKVKVFILEGGHDVKAQ